VTLALLRRRNATITRRRPLRRRTKISSRQTTAESRFSNYWPALPAGLLFFPRV
jgi:hypothetical protein